MDPVSLTAEESLRAKGALASLTGDPSGALDVALLGALSRRGRVPSPLALRLCHARCKAMRRCVDATLDCFSETPQVISIGAGLDGEMLRLLRNNRVSRAIEVDVDEVSSLKARLLERAFGVQDDILPELASVDVCDDEALRALVRKGSPPTVVVSECCLSYVPVEAAVRARRALAETCDAWIEFTPFLPDTVYGRALADGFKSNDAPLVSAFSSLADIEGALKRAGWPHTTVRSLDSLSEPVSARPLYEGELFDEHAALVYARRHYLIAVAAKVKTVVEKCFMMPSAVRIRRFQKDDLSGARACYDEAMRADAKRVVSIAKHARQTLKSIFGDEEKVVSSFGGGYWVAVDEERIVGGAGLTSTGEIRCVAVAPTARRRGIASKLLDAVEAASSSDVVELETIGGMDAAVALYEKRGYELVKARSLPAKSGAFELRSYRKRLRTHHLAAVPLEEADGTVPKVSIEFVAALETHVEFLLPSPLYPRLGVVFLLGGRRYVARRQDDDQSARKMTQPTIPAGSLVRCELRANAEPAWAFPRRLNTFRSKLQRPTAPGCDEEGPCTCNAECLVA